MRNGLGMWQVTFHSQMSRCCWSFVQYYTHQEASWKQSHCPHFPHLQWTVQVGGRCPCADRKAISSAEGAKSRKLTLTSRLPEQRTRANIPFKLTSSNSSAKGSFFFVLANRLRKALRPSVGQSAAAAGTNPNQTCFWNLQKRSWRVMLVTVHNNVCAVCSISSKQLPNAIEVTHGFQC